MAKAKKAVDAAVDVSRGVKSALNDILDMSTEARKARAAEQGYDVDKVWYHGTPNEIIDSFDSNSVGSRFDKSIGHHFTNSKSEANNYAGIGGNVGEYHAAPKNTLVFDIDEGGMFSTASMKADLDRPEIIEKLVLAKREGNPYDSVLIRKKMTNDWNEWGDVNENLIMLDNTGIRSVNAAFDPAKRESANLLAGLGGAAVVGASVAPEDAEAAKLKVFHRTTQEAADAIRRSGMAHSNEPGFFVSNRRDGQAVGYGDGVVELNVPEERLVLDDEFPDGEQHFRINPNSLKHDLSEYDLGFADPAALAVTAAITGAATEFYRRRDSKKSFWQQRREELSDIINAGDELIRPVMPYLNSALEALDKPMQGYYGIASTLGSLAQGNSLDASLQRGATVARQPIEQTAQEYGGALADEGYPLAGTALNTAMQVAGPF